MAETRQLTDYVLKMGHLPGYLMSRESLQGLAPEQRFDARLARARLNGMYGQKWKEFSRDVWKEEFGRDPKGGELGRRRQAILGLSTYE